MRALILAFLCCLASPLAAERVTVFAAASLGDVLEDAGEAWTGDSGNELVIVAAGSSVLARQIVQGAPADVYLSASPDWMDWAEAQGAVDPATRRTLMGNSLVLVGQAGGGDLALTDLPERLGEGRLAMALTEAVPAGIYGRAALTALGLWEPLRLRLAETDNVRAALALVALGEAPYGVVYATDALAEPRVRVVAAFPQGSHPPIAYPGAVTTAARHPGAAAAFLDWMQGDAARAILARHGFAPPP
ncbi:molybdate ABC transporter substrate-binding protein [Aestuariicoccus sp. MJ-SS9]|uniref:molybdate ABC transporter substrate-binding protein n=1 Tax=Aestuariicoccus sp. MJ-SS9 TaxID=3079855 RepID=UPI002907D8AB|nr:molybdate ABC transporter substrate-binding protein [Aestuariicoccus sp. MJ-SS9]MDU8911234.1 molybdate ABC transporter substrate-binding protein [Aestuariicoccus sp. MJ-SS9]